jgi:hypothetical protein
MPAKLIFFSQIAKLFQEMRKQKEKREHTADDGFGYGKVVVWLRRSGSLVTEKSKK